MLLAKTMTVHPKNKLGEYEFLLTYVPDVPVIPLEANQETSEHKVDVNLPPLLAEPYLTYNVASEINDTKRLSSRWKRRAEEYFDSLMKTVDKRDTGAPKVVSPYNQQRGKLRGPLYGVSV